MTRILIPAVLALVTGCTLSTHATQRSALGTPRSTADLLAVLDQPGPVTVETVASVDWEVDRGGLINLSAEKAKQAGLVDGPEPIQIYFHALEHPTQGLFIVDTGVEVALRDAPDTAAIRGPLASFMKLEKMKFHAPLKTWLAAQPSPLAGVFLTHLHFDHVSGMPDVPNATPIYAGPGEMTERAFLNLFVGPSIDRALEGKGALNEWAYAGDATGRFDGVLDVFGDGTVWALHVPGHTAGATAYVVRTPTGPVLLTGDACHTRWGWDHDVEPGSFNADGALAAKSLAKLRALAAEHPAMDVRLGHQR